MKKMWLLATTFAAILGTMDYAPAQVYPSRPITMVVPFPPGGPLDTVARITAEAMRVTLGQPVIIENAAGAAGTLGVGRAHARQVTATRLVPASWAPMSSTEQPIRCNTIC